jgi:uncharacterized metal-binding protein
LKDEEKIHPGAFEALCNPIAQASLLARAGTELNFVIGLCVGHDSLFFMHSKVPAARLVLFCPWKGRTREASAEVIAIEGQLSFLL